jgi:hypothetical protein
MGCDIHTFIEKKPNTPATGVSRQTWGSADFFEMNKYFNPTDADEDAEPEFSRIEVCGSRNYNLFAILANVRNQDMPYICKPKGIPDDCSDYVEKQHEREIDDLHSASWFTLFELKEYRNKVISEGIKTQYSGYMSPENAALVDKGEMPTNWWGGGNILDQVFRKWESQQDTLGDLVAELEKRKTHTFGYDRREEEEIDKSLRFVFWFDN